MGGTNYLLFSELFNGSSNKCNKLPRRVELRLSSFDGGRRSSTSDVASSLEKIIYRQPRYESLLARVSPSNSNENSSNKWRNWLIN